MNSEINSNFKYDRANIELRRNRVLDLLAQGTPQNIVAQQLNVSTATVSLDIQYLEETAKENIEKHIHETMPMQYSKTMAGLNQVLRKAWEIVNKEHIDDKVKLQSLALINESYRLIFELISDGTIIKEAMAFVKKVLVPSEQEESQVIEQIQQQGQSSEEEEEQEEEEKEEVS